MTQVAGYLIGDEIGVGPLGKVYAATNTETGQRVVFRGFMKPANADEDHWNAAIRTYTECLEAAKQLKHPNIAEVYDFGSEENVYWIATEYFTGETILQHLDKLGAQDIASALKIVHQIADALTYASQFELVHTDLTPYNVLLVDGRDVKVINFGLAHTRPKWGSAYAAPEQLRHEPEDERTDVFSLGCLTYELIVGDSPFIRIDEDATAAAVLAEPVKPIESLPENVSQAILKMLEKEPAARYTNAAEAMTAIENARQQLPPPPPAEEPAKKHKGAAHVASLAQYNLRDSDVRQSITSLRERLAGRGG